MLGVLTNFFDEGFWLPDQVTWDSFTSTPQVRYVEHTDLYVCLLVVPTILLLRHYFLQVVAPKFGRRLGLKSRNAIEITDPAEGSSTILHKAFQRSSEPSANAVTEIAKQTDLSESYILNWFRKRRQLQKPSKLEKFSECCLYFTWYTGTFLLGIFSLYDKCWFTNTVHYWKDYPRHPLSNSIYVYYIASISFYMSEVFATMFKTIRRKDDMQMAIHHVVTLALLIFSWWINHCRIGSIVLVIHDFSDIWLQLGKMARYVDAHRLCDAGHYRYFSLLIIVLFHLFVFRFIFFFFVYSLFFLSPLFCSPP